MKESIYLIVTCRHLYLCMPVVKQCPCNHGHHEVVGAGVLESWVNYGNSATWTCLVSVVLPIFSTLACRWHCVILNHGPINTPILLKIGIGLTVFGTPTPKLDQLTTNLRRYPVELNFKIKWPNASQDAVNWFLTYGVWRMNLWSNQ